MPKHIVHFFQPYVLEFENSWLFFVANLMVTKIKRGVSSFTLELMMDFSALLVHALVFLLSWVHDDDVCHKGE